MEIIFERLMLKIDLDKEEEEDDRVKLIETLLKRKGDEERLKDLFNTWFMLKILLSD